MVDDQDGRRVGADAEERAVADRDLAVETGQQVQAERGDGVDRAPDVELPLDPELGVVLRELDSTTPDRRR